LAGIGEFDAAAREDGWAQQMIDLLGDAHRWVAAYLRDGHTRLHDFKADDLRTRREQTIERALRVHPPWPGKQPRPQPGAAATGPPHRVPALRYQLRRRVQQQLRGADHPHVSGGFRTLAGARAFLAIRGYTSTIRKNGLRAADVLLGNPWIPPGYTTT
jgi:hypothetical protein